MQREKFRWLGLAYSNGVFNLSNEIQILRIYFLKEIANEEKQKRERERYIERNRR